MKRIAPGLYRLARKVNDAEALASLNPVRIARRAKNNLVGRWLGGKLLGKFWRL